VRQFAFAFPAYGCQGGLYQEISLQVYDESVRLNPDVATFNLHVFRSGYDRVQYGNCSQPMPTPIKSFLQQSCTGFQNIDVGLRDPVPDGSMKGPLFVIECLSPDGCWIRIRYQNKCTLKGTGAFPIGIIGIVLCSLVVIGCIALSAYFVKHNRFVTGEMWYLLFGIALIMILNLVFWICFVLTAVFDFPYWYTRNMFGSSFRPRQSEYYSKVTDTVHWIDKIVLVLSLVLHLLFLYQFVIAVHKTRQKQIFVLFSILVVVSLLSIGLTIPYYVGTYGSGNLIYVPYLIAFYAFSYGGQFVFCLLFMLYAIFLLRDAEKVGKSTKATRRRFWKTIFLLIVLMASNIGRFIVIVFSWLRTYFANSARKGGDFYFSGFDYIQVQDCFTYLGFLFQIHFRSSSFSFSCLIPCTKELLLRSSSGNLKSEFHSWNLLQEFRLVMKYKNLIILKRFNHICILIKR
jgi:hypothetical protein